MVSDLLKHYRRDVFSGGFFIWVCGIMLRGESNKIEIGCALCFNGNDDSKIDYHIWHHFAKLYDHLIR